MEREIARRSAIRCFLVGAALGVGGFITSSLIVALLWSVILRGVLYKLLFLWVAAMFTMSWVFFLLGGITGFLLLKGMGEETPG